MAWFTFERATTVEEGISFDKAKSDMLSLLERVQTSKSDVYCAMWHTYMPYNIRGLILSNKAYNYRVKGKPDLKQFSYPEPQNSEITIDPLDVKKAILDNKPMIDDIIDKIVANYNYDNMLPNLSGYVEDQIKGDLIQQIFDDVKEALTLTVLKDKQELLDNVSIALGRYLYPYIVENLADIDLKLLTIKDLLASGNNVTITQGTTTN